MARLCSAPCVLVALTVITFLAHTEAQQFLNDIGGGSNFLGGGNNFLNSNGGGRTKKNNGPVTQTETHRDGNTVRRVVTRTEIIEEDDEQQLGGNNQAGLGGGFFNNNNNLNNFNNNNNLNNNNRRRKTSAPQLNRQQLNRGVGGAGILDSFNTGGLGSDIYSLGGGNQFGSGRDGGFNGGINLKNVLGQGGIGKIGSGIDIGSLGGGSLGQLQGLDIGGGNLGGSQLGGGQLGGGLNTVNNGIFNSAGLGGDNDFGSSFNTAGGLNNGLGVNSVISGGRVDGGNQKQQRRQGGQKNGGKGGQLQQGGQLEDITGNLFQQPLGGGQQGGVINPQSALSNILGGGSSGQGGIRLANFVDTDKLNEEAGQDVQKLLDDNMRPSERPKSENMTRVENTIREQTGGLNTDELVAQTLNQHMPFGNLGQNSRSLTQQALNQNNVGGGSVGAVGGQQQEVNRRRQQQQQQQNNLGRGAGNNIIGNALGSVGF